MDCQEVLRWIYGSATEEDISLIFDAGNAKSKSLRDLRARVNASLVTTGTRVRLQNLSPKYLNGRLGTVVFVDGKKAKVEVDNPIYQGRFYGAREITVPASCLKILQ